mgnify:CR=1 FL=1
MSDHRSLIEDELLAIHHSGEMPEVALHASLHYLRDDPEGPQVNLSREDMQRLKDAVEKRYKRILMRDLNPRYRGKSIYRGLARAAANWQRLVRFGQRANRDISVHRQEVAHALEAFLEIETADVAAGKSLSSVNCSADELAAFAESVGLAPSRLPDGWQALCPGATV